jgi:hypothetical protein
MSYNLDAKGPHTCLAGPGKEEGVRNRLPEPPRPTRVDAPCGAQTVPDACFPAVVGLSIFIVFLGAFKAVCEEPGANAERKRLQSLTAAEREELRLKKERFDRLSDKEKQGLRRMHQRICSDPEAEKLRQIMVRYNEWLKSLPSSKRADLLDLPTNERLADIKRIVVEQEEARFNELVKRALLPQDFEAMIGWLQERVLSRLPVDLQSRITDIEDPRRRRFETMRLYRHQTGDKWLFESQPLTAEEIQMLTDKLSEQARKALNKAEDVEAQNRIVRDWIGAGFFSSFRPHVSEEELKRFLEEHVDAKQREYLENLPRERMMRELLKLYGMFRIRRTFADSGPWSMRKRRSGEFRIPDSKPPFGQTKGDEPP